jgi:hypothetical protein
MPEPLDLTSNPLEQEQGLHQILRNSTFVVCQCWVDLDKGPRNILILKAAADKPITESFQVMMTMSDGETTFGHGEKSIYQTLLAIGIKWATFTSSEAMLELTKEEGTPAP